MHMVASKPEIECTEWLAANTAYCKRHRASLTVEACKQNQGISAGHLGDHRCEGCNGLDKQPEEVRDPFKLYLAYPSTVEYAPAIPEGGSIGPEPVEPETTLDQDDLTALLDLELDLDDETLASITNGNSDFCRELQSLLIGEDEPDETPEQVAAAFKRRISEGMPRRYAVFAGRCLRCNGYMDGTREGKDDNVHRCLACGWRTSPGYEWNRAHPELAGWRG